MFPAGFARWTSSLHGDLPRILESSRIFQTGHDDFSGAATYAGNGFEELDSIVVPRQLAKLLLDFFMLSAETRQLAELQVQFAAHNSLCRQS